VRRDDDDEVVPLGAADHVARHVDDDEVAVDEKEVIALAVHAEESFGDDDGGCACDFEALVNAPKMEVYLLAGGDD
jgi:hypothetical protein